MVVAFLNQDRSPLMDSTMYRNHLSSDGEGGYSCPQDT